MQNRNETHPAFSDIFPDELTLEVLRHLNNRQLEGIARVDKQNFFRLANHITRFERGFNPDNIIRPNQTYYVLGNTVELTKRPTFGFYYSEGRDVSKKEIKAAIPKADQVVSLFRTREEAEEASSSQVDYNFLSPAEKPVVFAVKLHESQEALEVEFTNYPKSKIPCISLPADYFKIMVGYNPNGKEVKIAKDDSHGSAFGFFKKAKHDITEAISSLAHGNHRPDQPK